MIKKLSVKKSVYSFLFQPFPLKAFFQKKKEKRKQYKVPGRGKKEKE